MSNKNAKVIIPTAVAAWLVGIVVSRPGTPGVIQAAFVVAFVVAIPLIVFYLMAESGWRALARGHRAVVPFNGPWRLCATGQMAPVSVDHPDFRRIKMRFIGGTLRIGTTDDGLYLSTLFSKLPVLQLFFPTVRIPWSAIRSARAFEAPGWFTPLREPGTLLQVAYDPNYTGKFIEIEVGEPPVFLQLSAEILGESISRLPLVPET